MFASLGHGAVNSGAAAPEFEQSYLEVPVESIQEFVHIYGIVKDNYVDHKSDNALFQLAIQGMVSGLDRYSRYLSPEDYKQLIQYTEGEIATVDFELEYNQQHQQWVIAGLQANADSAKQGLRNGVTVFKIDGQEIKNLNHDQVNSLLTGSIASSLSLQLAANSQQLQIVRNKKIDTAIQAQMLSNKVLLVKLKVFQQDTANELKAIIEQYSAEHPKAVLIDLRNNPGGLLSAAVETADLFLNQGLIVVTKSRSEGEQQFQALPSNELNDLKVGILINARSASAAEVFTAAMKVHKRAWVIGEKSYGKGVVQKLFPLSNGAALQMTVAHYYTPNGQMIEGLGIQPNQSYAMQLGMSEQNYLERVGEMLATR
ncbi:S41 family peptidase [Acinetobacter sp. B51(2017)]|uniref:S41 family peptidase n=1 Tax=Acinetobacter sp. B51(2017) TaxID=2060938 RepID=UPI0020777100|nr:S41 family peptidase [Acinetobacter sp. B51(2017)]